MTQIACAYEYAEESRSVKSHRALDPCIHKMLALVWCACVLGTATARLYDKCELAHDLAQLGVRSEHIPTWVCIAYHESRLETSAHNQDSGDHGILQISQLYWCGYGKACGLSCTELRDDDIADDVQCALQVYEEHTRLQGDGFLAWVVYPQHCKQNVKKYLIDCDETKRPTIAPRMYKPPNATYFPNIDKLKPPYMNAIYRNKYYKETEQKDQEIRQVYKIYNIDSLKIPVYKNKEVKYETQINTNSPSETFKYDIINTTPKNNEFTIESVKISDVFSKHSVKQTKCPITQSIPTRSTTSSNQIQTTRSIFRSRPNELPLSTTPSAMPEITSKRNPFYFTSSATTLKRETIETTTLHSTTTSRPTAQPNEYQTIKSINLQTRPQQNRILFNRSTSTTSRPTIFKSSKMTVRTTTISPNNVSHKKDPSYLTTTEIPRSTTDFSAFDLYLNTRRPSFTTYSFAPFVGKRYRVNIVYNGSTSSTTPSYNKKLLSEWIKVPLHGATRNQFKRQNENAE